MKQNVTLKLDAEILKEARVLAAERGSSVSRMLAEKLEEYLLENPAQAKAIANKVIDAARARYCVCAPVLTWAGNVRTRETNCMNGKCFVDTNILVYAHDITQGVKHERARELINSLWESGNGVLSTAGFAGAVRYGATEDCAAALVRKHQKID